MTKLPRDVVSRLENWKFSQAWTKVVKLNEERALDASLDEAGSIILALSMTFGDVGEFDGHLSTVVVAATQHVIDKYGEK